MHRGPKAGRTTRKCYGTFHILRANRGLKAGRKTRKRFGDFPTLCKIRWDSFDEFVSFWPAIVCSIGGLGVLANRGPKAGRQTRKWFGDFPIFRHIRLASFDEFVTLGPPRVCSIGRIGCLCKSWASGASPGVLGRPPEPYLTLPRAKNSAELERVPQTLNFGWFWN